MADWEKDVPEWAQWVAQDEDGDWWAFEVLPDPVEEEGEPGRWMEDTGQAYLIGNGTSIIPWTMTLLQRPSKQEQCIEEVLKIRDEAVERSPDMVNHPPHYKQGDIECIDAIKAALTPEEYRGYCKGNALKYVWRELHKGGVESLRKAQWYLSRIL